MTLPNPSPVYPNPTENPAHDALTNTWTVYYYCASGTAWTFVQANTHAQATKNAKKRLGDRVYKVQLWAANGPIAN